MGWPDLSKIGSDNMRKVTARDLQVFLMPAATVRVPGGSPFSQLQRREKDNSRS